MEGCNSLKFLFSTSMAKYLMQLHNLEIHNCMSMEAVIKTEGLGGEEDITKITFPKLFYLELKDLPKCTRFGAGEFLEFPSLEALHIQSCPNLKTFFSSSPFVDLSENRPTDMHPLFDEKVKILTHSVHGISVLCKMSKSLSCVFIFYWVLKTLMFLTILL